MAYERSAGLYLGGCCGWLAVRTLPMPWCWTLARSKAAGVTKSEGATGGLVLASITFKAEASSRRAKLEVTNGPNRNQAVQTEIPQLVVTDFMILANS